MDLPKKVLNIVHAIAGFDRVLSLATRQRIPIDDLRQIARPLFALGDFFFLVACRLEPSSFPELTKSMRNSEEAVLFEFSVHARPLAISVLRHQKNLEKSRLVLRDLIWVVYNSPLGRSVVAMSTGSGVVMIIGVLLFGITPQQAFLTWFAACFGSFAVSLGVTSIRFHRDETPNPELRQLPPEPSRSRRQ
jgi:hypothetical protein